MAIKVMKLFFVELSWKWNFNKKFKKWNKIENEKIWIKILKQLGKWNFNISKST